MSRAQKALVLPSTIFTCAVVVSSCASDKAATVDAPETEKQEEQGVTHGQHGEHSAHSHGEMHVPHRFDDAEKWAKEFEDPARDAWQRPELVIAALGLAPSSKVADIGAATGYFAVRIAPKVKEGLVYGIDLEEEMVTYLNARAQRERITNLRAVKGEPADARIPEPVDVVLLVNTYHHIEDRTAYFARLRKSILPGGRVAIVDFKMGDLPFGPPESMRISPDDIIQEMGRAGYVPTRDDRTSLPHQVILIFTPRA
jgi:SAM-dependent methyltransferase